MKTSSRLALGLFTVLATPIATLIADEDRASKRPTPTPSRSGEGQLDFTSSNVNLMSWLPLDQLDGGSSGSDCWGYTAPSGREYAIICTNVGTNWVEVTDPGAPSLVASIAGPPDTGGGLWHDVKTFGDNAYVVTEQSATGGGIQIFDMANIDSGTVTLVNTIGGGCTSSTHNIAIDTTSGFLYRLGGSGSPCPGSTPQGMVIYDLNANPNNPPQVGLYTTRYVHDAQIVVSTRPGALNGRQLAFCAADNSSGGGNANLHILDVTNKASITTVAQGAYTQNSFSHQVWLTADQRYCYLNDELDESNNGFNTRTRIFDVSNPASPVFLGFFSSGVPAIDHNLYVHDGKIFEANYRSGLRVFDATVPTAPTVYGFFDTFDADDAAQFDGLWSNYPFFPSGTVIGSDFQGGLFVWRLGAPKLTFAFPSGAPEFLSPTGASVQFEVNPNMVGDLMSGSVRFHYQTNGGSFSEVTATPVGGNLFQANLPAISCGTQVGFFLSAKSSDGATWSEPAAGSTQVFNALAAIGQTLVLDNDMETAAGWTGGVGGDTATTGTWTRGNPIGTGAQPEDDHSNPGTQCWFTGQGPVGGGLGDNDVDGGTTTLLSPVFSAAGLNDPVVSYWRWYSNSAGAGPGEDTFVIDISNNGGTNWTNLETVGPTGLDVVGGWIQHTARIADFVTPTANMRLRFRASDLGTGSIVEAAIDDFQVNDLECMPAVSIASITPGNGPFDGGNVITITGEGFVPGNTSVTFGLNASGAVNVVSSTQLNVMVPAAEGPAIGKARLAKLKVPVTVIVGVASATVNGGYTYEVPLK